MESSSLSPSNSTIATAPIAPRQCAFIDAESGANCLETKLKARGYCNRHYKALERTGAFKFSPLISPASVDANEKNVKANARIVRRVLRRLHKNAVPFVDDWIVASKNAAAKGNSDPAMQALLHMRAIEPIAAKSNNTTNAIQVNVGVKLAGVSESK